MARYHINAQGNPGVCHAKKACPFGDMDSDHYSSKEDARSAYEVKMNETSEPEVKSGDYITDDFYDNIPVKVLEVRKGWSPDVKIPSWAGKTSASEYADQKVYVYENDMGNKAQTSEHATHPSGPPKTLEEQMLPGSPATADTVGRGTQVQRQVQGNDYDDMYATEQATVTRVRKRGGKPVGVNIEGEWSQGYYSFDELPKLWNKIDNQ
jgi:hypothetical protein